ncbi:hypothetical protein L0F63_004989, partial [Massospora cicadina]
MGSPQTNAPSLPERDIDSTTQSDFGEPFPPTIPLSTDEAAKVVRKHLLFAKPAGAMQLGVGASRGAITREIYRWQFAHENSVKLKRSNSFPGLVELSRDDASESYNAHEILLPGGFRRHFVQRKAYAEGRTPNLITRNFIDFLALYGHFAGEDYPSDEDDSTDESESASINHPQISSALPSLNESSPLLPAERKRGTQLTPATSSKVLFLLVKSFLGAGVLFLPRAFYNGGMILSSAIVITVSLVGLYSLMLLIECHRILGGSYAEIANRLYGSYARRIITASVLFSQDALYLHNSSSHIPMSMVRKIKYFSLAAFFADLFIISGLSYLYYFDINRIARFGAGSIENFNPAGVALMASTAIFAFEGVGLVLPIAESMEEPKRFPRLLSMALLISTLVLLTVGSLSYAAFGDEVNVVVLRNLPAAEPISQTVRLIYSLAVSFAVPLQLFPAIRILEWAFSPELPARPLRETLLALALALLAYGGAPHLEKLVAFFGAVFYVPLYLIFPALLHRKALKSLPPAFLNAAP